MVCLFLPEISFKRTGEVPRTEIAEDVEIVVPQMGSQNHRFSGELCWKYLGLNLHQWAKLFTIILQILTSFMIVTCVITLVSLASVRRFVTDDFLEVEKHWNMCNENNSGHTVGLNERQLCASALKETVLMGVFYMLVCLGMFFMLGLSFIWYGLLMRIHGIICVGIIVHFITLAALIGLALLTKPHVRSSVNSISLCLKGIFITLSVGFTMMYLYVVAYCVYSVIESGALRVHRYRRVAYVSKPRNTINSSSLQNVEF